MNHTTPPDPDGDDPIERLLEDWVDLVEALGILSDQPTQTEALAAIKDLKAENERLNTANGNLLKRNVILADLKKMTKALGEVAAGGVEVELRDEIKSLKEIIAYHDI